MESGRAPQIRARCLPIDCGQGQPTRSANGTGIYSCVCVSVRVSMLQVVTNTPEDEPFWSCLYYKQNNRST